VRSNPIPVVKCLNLEEETLLANQIKSQAPEVETIKISSFQLANLQSGEVASVVVTEDHVFLASNFFSWILCDKTGSGLGIRQTLHLDTINALTIYQSMAESITLQTDSNVHHLTFQSERGLQNFVRSLRTAWETKTERKLEEITGFHPTGSRSALKMVALMEESVSFKNFDFSQWIRVTSLN